VPTPTEIRVALPAKITALKISATDLSKLTGWNRAQISGFLDGSRQGMGIDAMNEFYQTVVSLERLAAMVAPLPINFSDAEMVNCVLTKIAAGDAHLETLTRLIREADSTSSDIPSLENLILLSSILNDQDLKQIADSRQIPLSTLREQVAELGLQSQRAFSRIIEGDQNV
jgi:hypothetical protein